MEIKTGKRFYALFCLILISSLSFAQIMVKGVVKGEDTYGVPGANVLVKGTTNGTITDIDGNYSISVPSEKSVLVFSFVGMSAKEITVGKQKVINVVLEDDSKVLDEVVVVGYGQMKKSDLTGAIGSYRPDERDAGKVSSIDNMLQGKIAGLSIGASVDAPGAASSVTIRGANSLRGDNQPLYVIDNIPQASAGEFGNNGDSNNFTIATNALSSLNPADIESIEVLKDASATAIYGSRGANGVILVTTKKGKAGKIKVGVSANFTIAQASHLLEMMDLKEYAQYNLISGGGYPANPLLKPNDKTNEMEWNDYYKFYIDGDNVYRANGENSVLNEPWTYLHEKDWQREVYSNALSQNYSITLNGGSEKMTYFTSASYKDIEGLVRGTGLKQGDFRLNLNTELSKTVKLALSVNGSIKQNDMMSGGNTTGGATGAISSVALTSAPYERSQEELDQLQNVYDRATIWTWIDDFEDRTTEKTFRGSLDLTWDITKWLSYNLRGGGNITMQDRDRWYGVTLYTGAMQNGYATQATFNRNNYSVENILQFNHKVKGIMDINATAGFTYDNYQSINSAVVGNNFSNYDLRYDGMHLAGNRDFQQPEQGDYQLISFLARANLSFLDGRYLLTASIRGDGSSKFMKGNRWAYFPAATVAWRLEQEKFMKEITWINQLKVRAGYGETGSQSISSYSTISPYASSGDGKPAQSASGDGNKLVGLVVNKLANTGLKWERTSSYNIGVDFSFLKDRIGGSFDVYSKTTKDLLIEKELPKSMGYSTLTINQGSLRNKGVELSLHIDPIRTKNFTWNVSGNISFNDPKILEFGLPEEQMGYDDNGSPRYWKSYLGASIGDHFREANIFIAGQAPGLFYGYQTDGIIQINDEYLTKTTKSVGTIAPGEFKLVDRNENGIIDENDKTIIGNPNPDFTYGIQTSFTWKDLSLSFAFNGVYGNDILNADARYNKFPSQSSGMIRKSSFKEMYRGENPWTGAAHYSNIMPKGNSTILKGVFDQYVEDGSFLRCTDITLSYNLPTIWMKKIGFNNIGVFASVKNAFLLTGYSGYDPEVNTFAFDGTRPGIDLYSYPHTRSFIFGINVSF